MTRCQMGLFHMRGACLSANASSNAVGTSNCLFCLLEFLFSRQTNCIVSKSVDAHANYTLSIHSSKIFTWFTRTSLCSHCSFSRSSVGKIRVWFDRPAKLPRFYGTTGIAYLQINFRSRSFWENTVTVTSELTHTDTHSHYSLLRICKQRTQLSS